MSADAVLWIVMAFCLIVGCPIFVSLGVASTLALIPVSYTHLTLPTTERV